MIYKFLNYFSSQGTPFGAEIKLIGLIPPSHSQIYPYQKKKKKNRIERKRNLQALLRRKDGWCSISSSLKISQILTKLA